MRKVRTMKTVKVYAVVMDGFYSNIELREIDKSFVDNEYCYFKTLSGAKKYLLGQLQSILNEYKSNIKEVKSIKVINADGEYIRK
jgi:hypothetical protein